MTARRQLGFLWGSVALALVALSPLAERLAVGLPACPFKSILGFACATCGTTRAALALAGFDPSSAVAVNPLATVAWISLIAGGLVAGFAALVGRPLPVGEARSEPGRRAALRVAVVLAILGNWTYLILAGV